MDKDLALSKKRRLGAWLNELDALLVAFSGGVDSTFLLASAREVMGNRVWAATACSPIHPIGEQEAAARFCEKRDIVQVRFGSGEMDLQSFLVNPPERCYVCKRDMIRKLLDIADELGIEHVAHAANRDDLRDYRPGFKAAQEAGVLSPLVDAEMTKEEIRFLAREMGLSVWNKPAMACLASRIPYGTAITQEKLRAVEAAERAVLSEGFSQARVRHHGRVARIEVEPRELDKIMDPRIRGNLVERLRGLGFDHVSVDLEGYEAGKMNRELKRAGGRDEEEGPSNPS